MEETRHVALPGWQKERHGKALKVAQNSPGNSEIQKPVIDPESQQGDHRCRHQQAPNLGKNGMVTGMATVFGGGEGVVQDFSRNQAADQQPAARQNAGEEQQRNHKHAGVEEGVGASVPAPQVLGVNPPAPRQHPVSDI
jgi:hypothetical protein